MKRHTEDNPIDGYINPEVPGDLLHIDQAISSTAGRLLTLSGKLGKKRYTVVTLMIDNVSKRFSLVFNRQPTRRKY